MSHIGWNFSRNGFGWLEKAIKCTIEVVIATQNTSHFLQQKNKAVNHAFKSALRHLQSELRNCGVLDFGDVRMKLMLTVAAYNEIKKNSIVHSYIDIEIWPMNYRFVNFAEQRWDKRCIVQCTEKATKQKCHTVVLKIYKIANQAINRAMDSNTALRLITKFCDRKCVGP